MLTMSRSSDRISVFLFALFLLAAFVAVAFAAGYGLGKILL
jgi:nitrate reductase NapE component